MKTTTQRQQAARETRRKIVEAGLALVKSGGFGAVSVEAITRAAWTPPKAARR